MHTYTGRLPWHAHTSGAELSPDPWLVVWCCPWDNVHNLFGFPEVWNGQPMALRSRESESLSVMSDSSQPHGLYSPWSSSGQNTGVGRLSLLQGIFPTQGFNPGLLNCRLILYQLSHKESPRILEWVAFPFSRGSSQSRNQTGVSCIAGGFFTNWAMREVHWGPERGHKHPSCRVGQRLPEGPAASLHRQGDVASSFPVPSSPCGVPQHYFPSWQCEPHLASQWQPPLSA